MKFINHKGTNEISVFVVAVLYMHAAIINMHEIYINDIIIKHYSCPSIHREVPPPPPFLFKDGTLAHK